MKIAFLMTALMTGAAMACPQFNLKNLKCVHNNGDSFVIDSVKLVGTRISYMVEGELLSHDLPAKQTDENWITKIECKGNKIITTEIIGKTKVSNTMTIEGKTLKTVGKNLEADFDNGTYTNPSVVDGGGVCK